MSIQNLLKIIIVLLILCVGVGLVWYFFYDKTKSVVMYSTTNTPYAALIQNNSAFTQAEAAANAGKYDTAKQLYEQALAQAQDVYQKGQIEFKLALMDSAQGHTPQAIDEYKAIVADPEYDSYKILKAYAVQNMVELYYYNGDPAITAEIFKDAPYAQMQVPGDNDLTYRNLDQYAATFYPLALPELRIATWYASHVNASTTPAGESTSTYPALIQNAVKLANADIDRIKGDVNAGKDVPAILVRKEVLYLDMYENGLASAQDAEQASKDAVNMYAAISTSWQDGFARFFYAVLLSDLGPSRVDDLKNVLAPFYTSPAYAGSSALSFFASEKSNALGQKARLVKLARLDPKFKMLLISLGWKAPDF